MISGKFRKFRLGSFANNCVESSVKVVSRVWDVGGALCWISNCKYMCLFCNLDYVLVAFQCKKVTFCLIILGLYLELDWK